MDTDKKNLIMILIQGLWKVNIGILINTPYPLIGDKSLSKRDFRR